MSNGSNINFKAQDNTIGKILFTYKKYRIPRNQRPYAWTEDHVNDFWNDLQGITADYFIGSLVFNYESYKKDKYIEVIDGQQRMLTITIMAAALRDICIELKETNQADRIQRNCIAFEDMRGNQTYRITPGESTEKYFKNYIQQFGNDIENSKPITKEEKLIKNAYLFFRKRLTEHLKDIDGKAEQIKFLQDKLDALGDLQIIRVEIESEEAAYEIFETLNAKGQELSVADLLKNLIFKNVKPSNKDKDTAQETWKQISENVLNAGTDLEKFIRYYWLSKYDFVTKKRLYREIKKNISDYKEFLNDLLTASELYNMMINGTSDEWREIKNGIDIYRSLQGIRKMGATQCDVFFLSILRNEEKMPTKFSHIFDLVEKFTFQYFAIASLPANKVERLYSRYARKIEEEIQGTKEKYLKGNIERIFAEFENEIKDLKPGKEDFTDSFMDLEYKNKLTAYILSKINDDVYSTREHRLDFENVNIEHILPRTPSKEWKLKKDDIVDYVNKLGNLTLLQEGLNKRVGNKGIDDKVKFLSESQIPMTNQLAKEINKNGLKWSEKEIIYRQKDLAEIAHNKVWNL